MAVVEEELLGVAVVVEHLLVEVPVVVAPVVEATFRSHPTMSFLLLF